jgi:hypothetical protein
VQLLVIVVAVLIYSRPLLLKEIIAQQIRKMTVMDSFDPTTWRKQLDALPTGGRIPAFFFAHGCTFLSPPSVGLWS